MIRADFIRSLQHMEQEAANNGLWLTRRALNIVIKVIGWEMAGNPTMAARCLPPPEQDEYPKARTMREAGDDAARQRNTDIIRSRINRHMAKPPTDADIVEDTKKKLHEDKVRGKINQQRETSEQRYQRWHREGK